MFLLQDSNLSDDEEPEDNSLIPEMPKQPSTKSDVSILNNKL